MAQEGQLWEMAFEHLGADGLLKAVIEMWSRAAPPPRPLVEHLSTNEVSHDVLSILKNCPAAGRCYRARTNAGCRHSHAIRSSREQLS